MFVAFVLLVVAVKKAKNVVLVAAHKKLEQSRFSLDIYGTWFLACMVF
jgi:hypothetical protein